MPMATTDFVSLRVHTAMNTIIPVLLVILAALMVFKALNAGSGGLAVIVVVIASVIIGGAVRLARSGVVRIDDGRMEVRGSWSSHTFATATVDHLEIAGTDASPSLVHADSLVVVTRDGVPHPKTDFAQSSYGRSHGRSLGWLCDEVNGRLTA